MPGTTAIFYKLLWICYYYTRCFGMVIFGVRECNVKNETKNTDNFQATIIIDYYTQTEVNRISRAQQIPKTKFSAYVPKTHLWFHTLIRFLLCCGCTYLVWKQWIPKNYIVSILVSSRLATILICPTINAIVEICHHERFVKAMNALFHLIRNVQKLHSTYDIFQWIHVVFVALKVVTIIYELHLTFYGSFILIESKEEAISVLIQCILVTCIYINIHSVTLLYVCIDAIYGALNHYMRYEFIPRLRAIQTFGQITTAMQVDQLTSDMSKFFDLFKNVHRVGSDLHFLWQVPVASTLMCMYFGVLCLVYYLIWQYYDTGELHMPYVTVTLKLVMDILLLSLAAHRAIKSSQLIGCMGLENAMLVEDNKWHQQMDQFLYHIKLYEFKLSFLDLFDINNAMTLAFIGGILTAISIFLPFCIKTYRIQKFLEMQN